ncbi:MAG: hypothetical protein AB1428_07990 [Bacteroidota bacterium]
MRPVLWKGGDAEILLLPPQLRYAQEGEEGDSPHADTGHAGWVAEGETRWIHDDGKLLLEVCRSEREEETAPETPQLLIRGTAARPVQVELCAVVLGIPCSNEPACIDRFLRWRRVGRETLFTAGGQCVVRWRSPDGTPFELRSIGGSVPARLTWDGRKLIVEVFLDAAALHPRWQFSPQGKISHAAAAWTPGNHLALSFQVLQVSHARTAIAARYPRGAEAGFALTDHCDFDDCDRLETFLRGGIGRQGWLGRGLKMTKGVFTLPSSPPGRPAVPSLEDDRYRGLIEELRRDGSEIAPHALSEVGTVPAPEFHETLARLSKAWSPSTWIDHGNTIRYCYTMGGAGEPEYRLLDALRENGFIGLWSYHDAPAHGCATLNQFALPESGSGAILARLSRHLLKGELLIGTHYGRSLLEGVVRGGWGEAVSQSMSALRGLVVGVARREGTISALMTRAWRRIRGGFGRSFGPSRHLFNLPYTRAELAGLGAVLYPERGSPLHQWVESDLLMFTTIEAVHTRDIYTPGALERLVSERGLHIGHTYLLNDLPYIAGLFSRRTRRITGEWTEFLDSLTAGIRSGRIWNPTAGELLEWMRDAQALSVRLAGAGAVVLVNPLDRVLAGFSLLLPRDASPQSVRWAGSAPAGWRHWRDWLAVWGDLPPRSRTQVHWGNTG